MSTFSSALSQLALFLCPGVVYQTEQVACSLSEFQPSPKWSGFKLQTFDFDSVSTLSLCGPAGPLSELEGHANLRQPWFWNQGESLLHCPQNKRWDHVWAEWFLKIPSDGEGLC